MSAEHQEGGIALLQALEARGELAEPCRARIALDLLGHAAAGEGSVGERTPGSRMRIDRVRVSKSGVARCEGKGDPSGVQLLVWEVFAGRPATEASPPRLHDVLDDIHTDVDEIVGRAVALELTDIAELLDALASAIES